MVSGVHVFHQKYYYTNIRYFYFGMVDNDLYAQYPGEYLGLNYEYYVHVDEWFYRAAINPGMVIFQAPQISRKTPNLFSYTLSTVLTNPSDGSVAGAVGINFHND
jgi:hypothetical protein